MNIRYRMFMAKKAISVTLDTDNLTWLKGRAIAERMRSMSEMIDSLIARARMNSPAVSIRSVIGTVDINPSDPLLDHADEAIRAEFERSLGRQLFAHGQNRASGAPHKPVKKKRG